MLTSTIKELLYNWKSEQKKTLAVLVDPDKSNSSDIAYLIEIARKNPPDLFLVGGSLVVSGDLEATIIQLKEANICPVVIFPGSNMHLSHKADGVLFLSLISGRNPEFLVGQHVVAAPIINKMKIEPIATGYILIESGNTTTVAYISNTKPIPAEKTSVAVATAIAGEMLGLKLIYLDGGSGAHNHVPFKMVKAVHENTSTPLWVGGGIRNAETAYQHYIAGADLLVVGNQLEQNPTFLKELTQARNAVSVQNVKLN